MAKKTSDDTAGTTPKRGGGDGEVAKYSLATESGPEFTIHSAYALLLSTYQQIMASAQRTSENPKVKGSLAALRELLASISTSFSALLASFPAVGDLIQAAVAAGVLARRQVAALCASLGASPVIESLLCHSITAFVGLIAFFVVGIVLFVLSLALSGLFFALSAVLAVASGVLFSLSSFIAISGATMVLPAILATGGISLGIATLAVPHRSITSSAPATRVPGVEGKGARIEELDDDEASEEPCQEGFVHVGSPSTGVAKGGAKGSWSLFRRKGDQVEESLKPESRAALKEGRAVLS
uniref:Uncharacterized protein n=1 Tax=Hemiselmis andersenii TaxID=464988 RepID=A0A6U4NB95_HEMAN